MDIDLSGKSAIVTGGSRGIGRAVALAFARNGASVVACYINETDSVRALGEELAGLEPRSYVGRVDVSDEASVKELVGEAAQRFGKIDVLVNNAGAVSHQTIAEMDLDEWRRVIDTNLTSMYLMTRAALEHMPKGGSIVNIGSGVGMAGLAKRTHYGASKAGVVGFTRSLCKELGPQGIRANTVNPGIIETDQTSHLTPEQRALYERLASLGRLGESDDIANVVLFLASDLAGYVTGATIAVDGGI